MFLISFQAHSKAETQVRFVFLQRIETSYKLVALDVNSETLINLCLTLKFAKKTYLQNVPSRTDGLFKLLCFIWQLQYLRSSEIEFHRGPNGNSSLTIGGSLKKDGVLWEVTRSWSCWSWLETFLRPALRCTNSKTTHYLLFSIAFAAQYLERYMYHKKLPLQTSWGWTP